MEPEQKHVAPVRGGIAPFAAAVLILACHFAFLMRFYEPAISTLDSHGYYVQARQIARTGNGAILEESRVQYDGHGWKRQGRDRRVSMWPPGLPLVLAAAYRTFGPDAMFLVNPVLATLSLLAVFLVCRAWIGGGWGVAATAAMACLPFFNEHAFYGYSHIAVLFFMAWGLYFVTEWTRKKAAGWAFAAGVFAGFIPCIRYPAAVFAAVFAVYAVLTLGLRDRRVLRTYAAYALGAAVPLAALCIYNQRMFGSFTTTGYSLIGYSPATLFTWDALKESAPVYVQQLFASGAGYATALAAAGIAHLCARRETWKQGALLGMLILPVTLLYMAYPQIPHAQSLRFLLPTLPVYVIAAVWALKEATRGRVAVSLTIAVMLVVLTASWGLPQSVQKMDVLHRRHAALADASRLVKKHVPRGSVLIAGELPCHNLDVYGQWRLACDTAIGRNRATLYGGQTGDALYEAFLDDVQKWAGQGRTVYWLGGGRHLQGLENALRRRYTLELLDGKSVTPPGWRGMPHPGARRDGRAGPDAPWTADYTMGPAPEGYMDHLFFRFAEDSPMSLYRLEPVNRPHGAESSIR